MGWPSSSCQLNKANARSKTYEERSTIIHWYKSVEIRSGLAWNNQSLPLALSFFSPIKVVHVWTPQKHLHNILATIPSKSTSVLCDMPESFCEQSITVASTVVSLLNTGTPRKTTFFHGKTTHFWRCTSPWKNWWIFPAIATWVYRRVGYPTWFFRCFRCEWQPNNLEPQTWLEVVAVAVSLAEPVVVAIFPWAAAIQPDAQVMVWSNYRKIAFWEGK